MDVSDSWYTDEQPVTDDPGDFSHGMDEEGYDE